MFEKTIAALKAAEEAAQADLDALLVPVETDQFGRVVGGGFHWHAAGSGLLGNLVSALAATRADFEKRQANLDAANPPAAAETPTPEPEPTPEPAPEPPAPSEVTA